MIPAITASWVTFAPATGRSGLASKKFVTVTVSSSPIVTAPSAGTIVTSSAPPSSVSVASHVVPFGNVPNVRVAPASRVKVSSSTVSPLYSHAAANSNGPVANIAPGPSVSLATVNTPVSKPLTNSISAESRTNTEAMPSPVSVTSSPTIDTCSAPPLSVSRTTQVEFSGIEPSGAVNASPSLSVNSSDGLSSHSTEPPASVVQESSYSNGPNTPALASVSTRLPTVSEPNS